MKSKISSGSNARSQGELVSVLVPVYNVEQWLEQSLSSIANQTYSNLEIILINDGSTDSSESICREWVARDPRFRLYSYPNSGISKTRNRALSHATGDYIMFVDSDDYIEPDMIQVMYDQAVQKGLDFVQCGFVMNYRYFNLYRLPAGHQVCTPIEALHLLSKGKNFNNYPWGKLIAAHCFRDIRFPENVPGFEDTFTMFKALCNAKRAGTIPQRFYHYVQHRGSLTNRMSLEMVDHMRQAYEYQDQYLQMRFPKEHFSFDLQFYNSDMTTIYTMIVFSRKSDDPKFSPAPIDWSQLPVSFLMKGAYDAWLGIARLKLSDRILSGDDHDQKSKRK